ncbi:MAG TPA: preprotein translocase subunit SecG [Bacillota bacterium]|nr:preprotein translocase subunit SecG [Bacillota bacterium]
MLLTILFLLVSIILTVVIVIQPSKGEGLGAIGGGGQLFFAKNKGFEALLEKVTTWIAVIFMLLAIIAGVMTK